MDLYANSSLKVMFAGSLTRIGSWGVTHAFHSAHLSPPLQFFFNPVWVRGREGCVFLGFFLFIFGFWDLLVGAQGRPGGGSGLIRAFLKLSVLLLYIPGGLCPSPVEMCLSYSCF